MLPPLGISILFSIRSQVGILPSFYHSHKFAACVRCIVPKARPVSISERNIYTYLSIISFTWKVSLLFCVLSFLIGKSPELSKDNMEMSHRQTHGAYPNQIKFHELSVTKILLSPQFYIYKQKIATWISTIKLQMYCHCVELPKRLYVKILGEIRKRRRWNIQFKLHNSGSRPTNCKYFGPDFTVNSAFWSLL